MFPVLTFSPTRCDLRRMNVLYVYVCEGVCACRFFFSVCDTARRQDDKRFLAVPPRSQARLFVHSEARAHSGLSSRAHNEHSANPESRRAITASQYTKPDFPFVSCPSFYTRSSHPEWTQENHHWNRHVSRKWLKHHVQPYRSDKWSASRTCVFLVIAMTFSLVSLVAHVCGEVAILWRI